MCIRVSLLLRLATIVSLWLRLANRGQWIQLNIFACLLWRGVGGKCFTFGCPISATGGVSCLLKNPALTCHNDDESKSLLVVNRGSYHTRNCGMTRLELWLRTKAASWLCKGDCPKYTSNLDLVFHL